MDYYKILKIDKNASPKDVKKAWRSLSMIHHPDRNGGVDSNIYKNINAAYEILSDETKKTKYDMEQLVPDFLKNPNLSNNPFEFINLNANPENMFRMFFNTASSMNLNNSQPINRNRTRITQTVTLNDLYNRISFTVPFEITFNNIQETDEVNFTVDGKVNNGDIIKTKSKNYNDVEIYIKLLHHEHFKKSDINIVYEKTISLAESLCGFSFTFKYLDNQEYTINNNIKVVNAGFTKVIKNMGLYSSGRKGSLTIIFDIEFPEIIKEENKEKLRELLS